ncbi:hypothetical protein [Comamonas aquatica]|uniref:hypothetical protein n=1 Tax=Comamonas aquatica TaxID=225991 RepID=UPI0034D556D2
MTAPDAELLHAHAARTQQAQHWLQQLCARGVLTFLLEIDGRGQLLPYNLLFSQPETWIEQLLAA